MVKQIVAAVAEKVKPVHNRDEWVLAADTVFQLIVLLLS